jgi:hypothetical protein
MMPWSDEQQRLLRAMGYVLYAQAPVATSMPLPVPVTGSIKTAEAAAPDFGRLRQSLQLAAMGRDISVLIADLATLRGDARAKRALWPQLRALRRSH